ncbi:Ribonuclease H domain - like 10 [Theobroma cacao]|nr:Ribonuclease H domain - like 10 [Theobroma cacao]
MCNTAWRSKFAEALVINLPRAQSDHCPILVNLYRRTPIHKDLRPFRFEIARLSHDSFMDFIKNAWRRGDNLHVNLTDFEATLKECDVTIFGNVFKRKRRLLAHLNGIQKALEDHSFKASISLNRNILWDAIGGKKKVVLIKWDIVCCPKRIGGLGIRKTAEMNKALLSKLGWKIEDGDQGLRAHVLRAKYLKERMSLWKALDSIVKMNVDAAPISNPIEFSMGGLCPNNRRHCIFGFMGRLDMGTILKAKLHAICMGLALAWDHGCQLIVVESDSKLAVQKSHQTIQDKSSFTCYSFYSTVNVERLSMLDTSHL